MFAAAFVLGLRNADANSHHECGDAGENRPSPDSICVDPHLIPLFG
jgi:hypothetical protein